MNVVDICAQDTGGQSFKMARAIREFTEHTSHSFCRVSDVLRFPVEISQEDMNAGWLGYMAKADIIHVHNRYRYANGWANFKPGVKWLIHRHGRIPTDRKLAELKADTTRHALGCVSTLNLLRYVSGDAQRWIPAPMFLDEFKPVAHEGIRIAHSPTNRAYKKTDLLESVVASLNDDGVACELVMIEGLPHAEALALKATCDITFDQIHLCYGNSGLEGMAFGQAVVVGMDPKTRDIVKGLVGYEPFTFADESTLYDVMKRLVTDAGYRKAEAARGREYVETFHAAPVAAKKMGGLYEQLLG